MSENPAGTTSALPTTLRLGGWLLVAVAAIRLVAAVVVSPTPGLWIPGDLAWTAALVVLAIGVGRAGSVVARRPLGVGALLVLAVWSWVERLVFLIVPPTAENIDFSLSWGYVSIAVSLAAAIIAVISIARAGVIDGSLRWAPLWGLVAATAPQVLGALALAAPSTDPQALAGPLVGLSQLVGVGVPLALGILAILRAGRPRERPATQVYPTAS